MLLSSLLVFITVIVINLSLLLLSITYVLSHFKYFVNILVLFCYTLIQLILSDPKKQLLSESDQLGVD